jgi:hypothetical protein
MSALRATESAYAVRGGCGRQSAENHPSFSHYDSPPWWQYYMAVGPLGLSEEGDRGTHLAVSTHLARANKEIAKTNKTLSPPFLQTSSHSSSYNRAQTEKKGKQDKKESLKIKNTQDSNYYVLSESDALKAGGLGKAWDPHSMPLLHSHAINFSFSLCGSFVNMKKGHRDMPFKFPVHVLQLTTFCLFCIGQYLCNIFAHDYVLWFILRRYQCLKLYNVD